VIGDREFLVEDKQGEKGYIKTYYPGTQDLAKASLITVKEGEEVSGIDIQLRRVSVYRVRGRLINQIKHKGETELLSLTGRTNGVVGQGGLKSSDGSFEFRNVVQGSYLLWAFWDDQGKQYGAHEKIEIGESDVEGVTLVIGTGVTIPGRILWDGKPSLERDELTVSVQSVDAPLSGQGASVEANQEFTLKNVGDGDYKVAVFGPSKDCYIKDTVYGATHSADGVIAVDKGGGEHLEIMISSRGARVEGAVVDKDGFPSPRVWVVAVPEEVKRTNLRLFRAQTTDPYGKFQLRGLAPGAYKLFSWTRIENNAWEDGDFLKPFEEKGQAIELSEGDAKTAILTVIETNAE
jgi:hypothetical protein